MYALCIIVPGRTTSRELPMPEPGPGEVLLRILRVGLCGSDLNTFRGTNSLADYPRIPGHELAARIEAVGAEVPGSFKVGARVTASPYSHCGQCSACRQGRHNACRHNQTLGVQRDGALVEWLAMPWQRVFASEWLNDSALALVEPLTIGFHAVDRVRVSAGDTVLVLGCGAVGLGAIAAASQRGARVLAVDVAQRKLETARAAGAAECFQNDQDLLAHVREATDGEGPSVAIEAVGRPDTCLAAAEAVAFGGRVGFIGYSAEPVCFDTKLFVRKELDLLGSRNAQPKDFLKVIQYLEADNFPVTATVSREVPFAQAGQAFADWQTDPGAVTKLQVITDPS